MSNQSKETSSMTDKEKWLIEKKKYPKKLIRISFLLFLLVRLEIGMGLEGCLNDAKSGRILDEWAVDAKDNARWNEAAINTWVAAAKEVYAEYGLTAPKALATVDSALEEPQTNTMADADFPEAVVVKNTDSFATQLMTAFFVTWMTLLLPFLVMLFMIYAASPMYYKESDFTEEGKLKKQKVVSDHDRNHYSGGSGGGHSGGGGSFGGGGASR